jgi:MFS family permease
MSSVIVEGTLEAVSRENTRFIVLISGIATIGGFLFGFDSGVINGTVEGLREAFGSGSAGIGFEVASMLLGCALGAFAAGRLADRYGRRAVLIVAAALFLVSALGAGSASSAALFVAARVVGGLAVGAASVMSPAYIAEVASARYRGRLATVQQIAIICGLSAAFVSNYYLARAAGASTDVLWLGEAAWRWMFWMQAIPSLAFLILLLPIPESPRYLVANGRAREAVAPRRRRARSRRSRSRSPSAANGRASSIYSCRARAACAPSSGSASGSRRSSSSSASTSSSTMARCCGRRSGFPKTTRCGSTCCRARSASAPVSSP